MPDRPQRLALLSMFVLLACTLVGCAGHTFRGVVAPGDVSLATIVDASDARLNDPGISGIDVRLIREQQGAGRRVVLASGTTDDAGAFDMKLPSGFRARGKYLVTAQGPGIFGVQSRIYFPADNERVLVLAHERAQPRSAEQSAPAGQ